jgi:hypothetical protein
MSGGGEGVFARADIPPDTLVAIFNGVRHPLCSSLIKGVGKLPPCSVVQGEIAVGKKL